MILPIDKELNKYKSIQNIPCASGTRPMVSEPMRGLTITPSSCHKAMRLFAILRPHII